MIEVFKASPLLLLFVVSAIGYAIGNISLRGARLGVAAVLFVGLGFGALDPNLKVPEIIIFLGLSIFVYTIGLSSGGSFFQSFKQRGTQDLSFIFFAMGMFALITVGCHFLFDLSPVTSAGLFAGSVTNTPSLASLVDLINNSPNEALREATSNQAVVGYSLSYPMGVIGVMLAIVLMKNLLKIDYHKEEDTLKDLYPTNVQITSHTIEITHENWVGVSLRDLFQRYHKRVVFGRMKRKGEQFLPNMDTRLEMGDQVVLVGSEESLNMAEQELGDVLEAQLSHDRTIYDIRRVFVSNPQIAGERIASLNLTENYSIIVTRVQRGDMDLVATGETVLELGDRILVLARRRDMPKVTALFGNSYEALSHINLFAFGLGMALGLLLGMIKFELPGGFAFRLGFAGGPLLVALVLGSLRRTGNVVWTLPFSANLSLRQFGLILLLAGIGIRSGHTFLQTLTQGNGALLLVAGAIITFFATVTALFVGYKWFKMPFSLLTGMVANQPAILDFAAEQAGNKLPVTGFTLIFPIGILLKILIVQLLYVLL